MSEVDRNAEMPFGEAALPLPPVFPPAATGSVFPPPPTGPAIGYASVVTGRRVVAGLIDLVPLAVLAFAMGDRTADSGQFNVSLRGLDLLWWLLASILYYAVAELATGTSPGKAIMGLCVRDELAMPPSKRQLLIRNGMRVIDILPAMYLVGLIAAVSSERRKRLGDMAADTVVLQRVEVGAPLPRGRSVAILAAVVVATVGLAGGLLAVADTSEKVGRFSLQGDVIPFTEEVLDKGLRPLSADALRPYVFSEAITDADLESLIPFLRDSFGAITDYEIVDHEPGDFSRPGQRLEGFSVLVSATFEKRPGRVILRVAEIDDEFKIVGLNVGE